MDIAKIMQVVKEARFLETLLRRFGGSEMEPALPGAVWAWRDDGRGAVCAGGPLCKENQQRTSRRKETFS